MELTGPHHVPKPGHAACDRTMIGPKGMPRAGQKVPGASCVVHYGSLISGLDGDSVPQNVFPNL